MKTVKVTNGMVRTGDGRFMPGSELQMDDDSADSLVSLGVAVIVEPEAEAEAEDESSIMPVEEELFDKPRKKKRGKRRG